MKKLLASLLALAASGCPDVDVDENEVELGPTVEFDPARSQATGARFIPFPNDLARDPMTGKLNLGPQTCESATAKATRENVLNKLDGFGTYQLPMQVTFTEEVDEASLADKIVVYQVTNAGMPLDPTTAMPVPFITRKTTTLRFTDPAACTSPETVQAVVIIPTVPLRQKSTYVVALKRGITNTTGVEFQPSSTWGLVSSSTAPVTLDDEGNVVADRTPLNPQDPAQLAQLQALAQLWAGHQPALAFLDAAPAGPETRSDLLVAFAFTTQTTTDPLDPSVSTSPAAMLSSSPFLAPLDDLSDTFGPFSALCGAEATTAPTQCFLKLALGGCSPLTTGCGATNYNVGNALCTNVYDCAEVGTLFGGGIGTTNYQTQVPNPLAAATGVTVTSLQGAWSDPVNPVGQGSLILQSVISVPTGTPPANGWPVVVFGHGLTGSKTNLFAIAGRLSRMGFAAIAIDFSQHGSRAVRTSTDPTLGCRGFCFSGATNTGVQCETIAQCGTGETCGSLAATPSLAPPDPGTAPQCYAPIFSGDLANTRDNIRQTVLDLQRVVRAVKACGASGCANFPVDATRIYYGGISLGSLIGQMAAAMSPDIKAASLNVGGAGWLDVLENTETLSLRCSLVNALIDAGILMGDKWAGGSTGLCTTDAWKAQPGYATFSAVARWVIDPAEPANFIPGRLTAKPHLIQKVVGDTVVPNVATDRQAALTGAAANTGAADAFAGGTTPSAIIVNNPTQNKYVTYTTDANHIYVHSTLLRPATSAAQSIAATLRMQVDFVQFLDNNDDNDD